MYHVHCNKYMSHTWLQTPMGLNHLVQRTSCRISIGRPLDFTGRCFKGLRIANFIEKCNKKFYWMSSRNSTGRPLESTSSRIAQLDVHYSRRFGGMCCSIIFFKNANWESSSAKLKEQYKCDKFQSGLDIFLKSLHYFFIFHLYLPGRLVCCMQWHIKNVCTNMALKWIH